MKRLFLTMILALFASPALAEDVYTPISPDNTVSDIKDVQVNRAAPQPPADSTLTMEKVDSIIARYEAQIVAAQSAILEWQAIRIKVEDKAKKVKLKKALAVP